MKSCTTSRVASVEPLSTTTASSSATGHVCAATDASAVRELDYTITVPSGSRIGKTTLTVGLGFPEKVTYVFSSSQAWGTMKVAATVQTQRGTPPFQTTLQATSPTSLLTGSSTASGRSNSTVTVTLKNLVMV